MLASRHSSKTADQQMERKITNSTRKTIFKKTAVRDQNQEKEKVKN
jgi:hypothetical protein